jgi:hypothetical protein
MRRTLKLVSLWGASGLLVILLLSPLLSHVSVTDQHLPRMKRFYKRVDKLSGVILPDLRLLAESPPFPALSRKLNADSYLAVHFPLLENPSPFTGGDWGEAKATLERYRTLTQDPELLRLALADPELERPRLAWLDRLREFDHWDFSERAEFQQYLDLIPGLPGGRFSAYARLPMPEVATLTNLTLIRAIQLHRQRKTPEALALLRHVARLLNSSGARFSGVATGLLMQGGNLFALAVNQPPLWAPEVVAAYQRVSRAGPSLIGAAWLDQLPEEYVPLLGPWAGMCDSVVHSIQEFWGLKDYLYHRAEFETNFRPHYKRLEKIQHGVLLSCALPEYDRLTRLDYRLELDPAARMPFYRRQLGLVLLRPMASTLEAYEALASRAALR